MTRNLLWEVLHADYKVEAVATGEEAWAAAQRELPDLGLSDVLVSGGLDGIGLTRQLRAAERTRILLTASNEQALLLSCLEAEADDCLLKPFNPPKLLARLLLASLSHELRTPLAPVQMALYLMDRSKGLPTSVRKGSR